MEIVMPKYWGLDYDKVPEHFGGELTYIGDFDCGNYHPFATWHAKNPDVSKGHKEFMMLYIPDGTLYVTGRHRVDAAKFLIRSAAHCLNCDQVIYSLYRHDYRPCKCKKIAVDGGSDYFKMSYEPGSEYRTGTLNLETKVFDENS